MTSLYSKFSKLILNHITWVFFFPFFKLGSMRASRSLFWPRFDLFDYLIVRSLLFLFLYKSPHRNFLSWHTSWRYHISCHQNIHVLTLSHGFFMVLFNSFLNYLCFLCPRTKARHLIKFKLQTVFFCKNTSMMLLSIPYSFRKHITSGCSVKSDTKFHHSVINHEIFTLLGAINLNMNI